MSGETGRWNVGASLLRIMGSMAIVVLHTLNASEILYRNQINQRAERLSMMFVYGLMWAVPVFVMVSGALLLDPARQVSLKKIFSSYILRVGLVLILCVFLFRLFDMAFGGEKFSAAVLIDALKKLVSGESWSHLWYLYMLLGLYLLLPAYRLAAGCDERNYRYLCIVGFIFLSLLSVLESAGYRTEFHIQISAVYTLYFFLGYGIASGKLPMGREAGSLCLVGGSVLIFLLLLYEWRSGSAAAKAILSSYASPAVVLQSVGIFACLWGQEEEEGKNVRIIRGLDALTFGVYLLHMIPLRYSLRYLGWNPYRMGWQAFVILVAGSLVFSALLTALLRLIPGVKKIL